MAKVKQKVVLKLSMDDPKKRAKAMQCAVGVHGVVSASHEGDNMTVVGEGIDPVALTRLLRKKMNSVALMRLLRKKMKYVVELVMVVAVEEKKEEKKEDKSTAQPIIWPVGGLMQPSHFFADVRDPYYAQNSCSIM